MFIHTVKRDYSKQEYNKLIYSYSKDGYMYIHFLTDLVFKNL